MKELLERIEKNEHKVDGLSVGIHALQEEPSYISIRAEGMVEDFECDIDDDAQIMDFTWRLMKAIEAAGLAEFRRTPIKGLVTWSSRPLDRTPAAFNQIRQFFSGNHDGNEGKAAMTCVAETLEALPEKA